MVGKLSLLTIAAAATWPMAVAAQSALPQPEAASGLWQQDTLTGVWGGLRDKLEGSGVTLGLQEESEGWGNLMGGLRRGATYDGLATASLRIDLDKLTGWPGATLFINAYQIHGMGPSESLVGNLQYISNVEAMSGTRLYDLWLEQNLLNGRLNIRLGQEGADDEMMIVDDAAVFLNASFGFPALPSTDLPDGGPAYPLASSFMRLKYYVNDTITLVGAAYGGVPELQSNGASQFAAFRLNDHALLFAELWYSRNKGADDLGLPATYKLGVWFDSASFPDQLYDNQGVSLANPASNGVPLQHLHDYAIYGILDQMVWRRDGTKDQGISLFLQIVGAPNDRNLSDLSVAAGVSWKAPFARRENDVFGFAAAYEGIGAAARQYSRELVYFSGSGSPYAGDETVLEATYQFQVAPWWTLQPDVQFVLNPGASIPSNLSSKALGNAFVIGLRTSITF